MPKLNQSEEAGDEGVDSNRKNVKRRKNFQNVGQMLPDLEFKAKGKLPNHCFRTFWEFLQVVPPVLIRVASIFQHFLTKIIWLLIFSLLCNYL